MSSRIHPQARTTPKIRQEIKDSGLSSREAAKVFNITRATAQKWLGRDDVHDRSHRAHTLHTTLRVIPPLMMRTRSRGYAARANFWIGVIPPSAMCGRS